MSNDPVNFHIQVIRQHIARLQQEDVEAWAEIDVALEDLHVTYEEMQTNLEAATMIEQQLFQQNQHYYDLFQSAPIAYLVTDADGVILEANQVIAQLLNVPYPLLAGKLLELYVAEGERENFRTKLNQSQNNNPQVWQINLCPRGDKSFPAYLQVSFSRASEGRIESLRIGVFKLSQAGQAVSSTSRVASSVALRKRLDDSLTAHRTSHSAQAEKIPVSPLPYALDGLRVLVVDDEAAICTFITALLESHGIEVKAVTSSAAALEEIEQFQPDVLLSDIRMAGGDGYDLIRQIRETERRQGRHIPAAAITAYLNEDLEKALSAGYEAYWYKLSQPNELLEVVGQLAERVTPDSP